MSTPTEVELKFQVPPARRAQVAAFVAGRAGASREIRLQAAYVDTPDRLLARAGMALRLRREGRQWVQTLKGMGSDGMTRDEHNLPLPGAAMPAVDPARHVGQRVGERLLALLAGQPEAALQTLFRTDIRRTVRRLRSPHGTVELAFDEGWLIAGEARLPVCELEIELLGGHPLAVLDVARRWALRYGLWLDTRSKAERGDMLARGVTMAAPARGGSVTLHKDQTACQGLQTVIAACRDPVLVNAAQIASGEFEAEHVHQLRVALRRLRSALRLFDGDAAARALAAPLAEPAADLFRRLGAARDLAVMDGELAEALATALRGIGADGQLPASAPSHGVEAPTDVLREPASQHLLLDLLAAGLPPLPAAASAPRGGDVQPAEPPANALALAAAGSGAVSAPPAKPARLRDLLANRLQRWHRAVLRDAARFDELDEPSRHLLRKRIKRLRYAAEFGASLFDAERVRRSLRPLRRVQERLGALNDVAVALQAFDALKATDPRAWFALGWLAARREELLAGAPPELRALAKRKAFWRKR